MICCSSCSARCCESVWVVTIWKAGEVVFALRMMQVLCTTVARSCTSVRKLSLPLNERADLIEKSAKHCNRIRRR